MNAAINILHREAKCSKRETVGWGGIPLKPRCFSPGSRHFPCGLLRHLAAMRPPHAYANCTCSNRRGYTCRPRRSSGYGTATAHTLPQTPEPTQPTAWATPIKLGVQPANELLPPPTAGIREVSYVCGQCQGQGRRETTFCNQCGRSCSKYAHGTIISSARLPV